MFADSTTNTALCRWSLLFLFLSSSVQIPLDGCPEILSQNEAENILYSVTKAM